MELKCHLVQHIRDGDIISLKNLLCVDKLVNLFIDNYLNTPLHLATILNNNKIVGMLLQAGASINVKNKDGDTPLHKASGGTNIELVEMLLSRGASTDIPNKDGNTPFHIAVSKSYVKIVGAMLDRGADIHVKNANGDSPLHLAVRHCSLSSTKSLVDRGASMIEWNNDGVCPLHIAVMNNCYPTTLVLLRALKHSVNVEDKAGWTALHLAVREGNRQLVKLLISQSALTNVPNCWGHTALHTAVRNNDLTMVDILLSSSNVLPDVRDMFGHTPLYYAIFSDYPGLIFRLLQGGATINIDIARTSLSRCSYIHHELAAYCLKLKIVESSFLHGEIHWYKPYTKLSASCFDEIELLRKTLINNYSLYDVFSKKADLVVLQDVFNVCVNSAEFQTNFPNYAFIIRSMLLKAKKEIFHLKYATVCFRYFSFIRALPEIPSSIILDHIFTYLTDVDLQNIVACMEKCSSSLSDIECINPVYCFPT